MIDTTAYKEFATPLMDEIQKMVADTERLVPENFNILSYGLAIDADKIESDISLSGLSSFNGIDYQKMRSVLSFLKTQKQSYLDKVFNIPTFTFGDEDSVAVINEEEDGTSITAAANSLIVDLQVPDGWDGRRGIVSWFIKKADGSSIEEKWTSWFLGTVQGGKGNPITRSVGVEVTQNKGTIRFVIQFSRSGSGKRLFPGMYVPVRFYRGLQ